MAKRSLFVTTDLLDKASVRRLSPHARVILASKADPKELDSLLPSVDAMMIFSWPKFLTPEVLQRMQRLRFIQSILAGVNHIPFTTLKKSVIVASNAGAYSGPVAEYAWSLLLSAAKRVVEHHTSLREGHAVLVRHGDAARGIYMLQGSTLGILGYGGIGAEVARLSRPFNMKVLAFARRTTKAPGVSLVKGVRGFRRVLRESDFLVTALPLTNSTTRIINKETLSLMKDQAILVNVARGELVDEKALHSHLVTHPGFRYATDVWWYKDGRESLDAAYDFALLPNFIGTPHVSGPSGLATGEPIRVAVQNTLRFLKGKTPGNIVDKSDYAGRGYHP
jgi:phosphoglycerate dehydrogenase-like enzyme